MSPHQLLSLPQLFQDHKDNEFDFFFTVYTLPKPLVVAKEATGKLLWCRARNKAEMF